MRVSAVEAIPVVVAKDRPFSSSLGTFDAAKAGIVRVRTDEGIEGVGEIAMLWHGGGSALCHDVNTRLGPALVGQDPLNIVRLHSRLEELCQFGYHTNPVRAAFDMAFYDILGKTLRTPVYSLIGG